VQRTWLRFAVHDIKVPFSHAHGAELQAATVSSQADKQCHRILGKLGAGVERAAAHLKDRKQLAAC
jgi:hypothetical protein